LIGFADLGDITNHLVKFERAILEEKPAQPKIAKTL